MDTHAVTYHESFWVGASYDECEAYLDAANLLTAKRRAEILRNKVNRLFSNAYTLCHQRRPEQCTEHPPPQGGDIVPKIYAGLAAIWDLAMGAAHPGKSLYSID